MDQNRWQEIRAAFDEVVALDAGDRADRLAILGATDPALRAAVEKLLAADAERSERLRPFEGMLPPEAEPARDPFDLVGRTISHFQVVEPLGAGGMGVVYRAEDLRLGRAVALKFLLPHLGLNASAKTRFMREARAAATLDHPNLCTVHEVGESQDGRLFLAMALYPGETLKDRLLREGALPIPVALEIARQIALGLGCAHAAEIVHRDLKPGNVMLLPDGTVKILDFGLARSRDESHSGASARWGTAAYMAPEQVSGQTADPRTDLWALGAVLYEMVTGKKPFGEGHEVATAHAILKEKPVPPSQWCANVAPPLEHLILTLLEKDPAGRPASASPVIEALTAPGRIGASRGWRRAPYRLLAGFAAAAALALGAIAIWQLSRSRGVPSPPASHTRIAVLPLQNLTGDTAQEYFVDGMHDALVTELAKIGALAVISRSSVLRYRNSDKGVPEIARELHVDAVVEGSVVTVGDSVRINAQLIEGSTDKHLWADSFVKNRRHVLALYGDMARAIAGEVRVALTPEERARLTNDRSVDPQANDLFYRGRYYCEKFTDDGISRGIALFQRAIDRDPTFALAWAWLSTCYAEQAMDTQPAERFPLAKAAALRALELDSTLGMPYVTLGWIRFITDLDFDGPDRDFRRALELSPGSSWIHAWYADYLMWAGRFDEALQQRRQAIDLNPLDVSESVGLAAEYFLAHHDDEAIAELRRTLAREPRYWDARNVLAESYSQKGMHEAAVAQCDSAIAMDPDHTDLGGCGWVYARAGRRQQALQMLRRITSASQSGGTPDMDACWVYVGLGDRDHAMESLRQRVRERSPHLMLLKQYPLFDGLRSDPRFQALLRELKMAT